MLEKEAESSDNESTYPDESGLTADSRYIDNTGLGTMLVDAHTAFNEINRYLMLWTVHHRWYQGSCFAFNRYRHQNIVYVRKRPGNAPYVIKSEEGVAQGCTFGMMCYGVAIMPMLEQMHLKVTSNLQSAYADDL